MRHFLPPLSGRYHFSHETIKCRMVEDRFGQQPFQTSVFVSQPLQPLGLNDIHAAILGFPHINGRIARAVLAAQIGDGNPGLLLFQNTDDLVFGEPAGPQLWSFRLGHSLSETGFRAGGNVRAYAHQNSRSPLLCYSK